MTIRAERHRRRDPNQNKSIMIGIILWAIVIIIIAECACPGLIWVILGCLAVYGAIYAAVVAIVNKLKK